MATKVFFTEFIPYSLDFIYFMNQSSRTSDFYQFKIDSIEH